MKCLAQKLTKWRRIEKLWQKRENEIFSKIERFVLCKYCSPQSTKGLSFHSGLSDFVETGLNGFVITNGKSQEAAVPQIPQNLMSIGISESWAEISPPLT